MEEQTGLDFGQIACLVALSLIGIMAVVTFIRGPGWKQKMRKWEQPTANPDAPAREPALSLPPEIVQQAITHMNTNHSSDLLKIVRNLGDVPWATQAELTDINSQAITLWARTSQRSQRISIPFERPISDPTQVQRALDAMMRYAQ